MRNLFLAALLLASPSAHAQIFADVSTSLGDFTIDLDYSNSPKTVANFIILAEGSRPWVDESTGKIRKNTPYYNGITFHRIIADFMSQTGSRTGDGTDGPGYNFVDETDNGLSFSSNHLVAMANSGPNTNGAQFFITDLPLDGSSSTNPTNLDGKHTIFGSISSGGNVVDAINNVTTDSNNRPTTPVIINSVTIRRLGSNANNFNEFDQDLPRIDPIQPKIVHREEPFAPYLSFDWPSGTTLHAQRSPDLKTWEIETRYLEPTDSSRTSFTFPSVQSDPTRQFYSAHLIKWPSDIAPLPDLENITIRMEDEGIIGTFGSYFAQIQLSPDNNNFYLLTPSGIPALVRTLENIQTSSDPYGFRISGNFPPGEEIYYTRSDGQSLYRFALVNISIRCGSTGNNLNPRTGKESGSMRRFVQNVTLGTNYSETSPLSLNGEYLEISN